MGAGLDSTSIELFDFLQNSYIAKDLTNLLEKNKTAARIPVF